jgi:uncharacterized Ntn-hydrolase superfamily protein
MRGGKSAEEALAALIAADPNPAVRQVAMVDAAGRVAVHTGEDAIIEACDQAGPSYSVQANLMLKPTVCAAMARAYETAEGDLAERMMAALEAAQAEGGDIRGKQSAALLIVSGDEGEPAWGDRMNEGDEHMASGDLEEAVESYAAAEALAPESHEMVFWHAVTLASSGRVEESLPLFARAFEMWPNWRILVERLPEAGLLPDDPALIDRIVAAGKER